MALSDRSCSAIRRYTRVAIALHWLLAAALLAQVLLGWWMLGIPKSPPGVRASWFNVHKSIGITIALFVFLRIVWRSTQGVPDADLGPAWQRAAARTMHRLLYLCMAVMPLTGFLGSSFTRYPIRYFGRIVPTPHADWPAAKEAMAAIHVTVACVFVALIAAHVLAAAWHWWQRDGVAARMGIPSLR
ncbi:MAG TPA: cytochrome b [Ramlibacter sp.]